MSTLVTYEIKYLNFLNAEGTQLISGNSSEDAVNNLLQAWPGIKKSSIREVRELPKIDEEKRRKREANGIKRTAEIQPTPISDDLVDYFRSQKATVRFLWAKFLDEAARERFKSLGRGLPENSRAIETGKNGGDTELWNVSCEVSFPQTVEVPKMPFKYTIGGKRVHIYDLGLGLELYCNQGFECTTATESA